MRKLRAYDPYMLPRLTTAREQLTEARHLLRTAGAMKAAAARAIKSTDGAIRHAVRITRAQWREKP